MNSVFALQPNVGAMPRHLNCSQPELINTFPHYSLQYYN